MFINLIGVDSITFYKGFVNERIVTLKSKESENEY